MKPITNWNEVPVLFDMPMLCRLLGISYNGARLLIKKENLPVHQFSENGAIRFDKDEVRQWINER